MRDEQQTLITSHTVVARTNCENLLVSLRDQLEQIRAAEPGGPYRDAIAHSVEEVDRLIFTVGAALDRTMRWLEPHFEPELSRPAPVAVNPRGGPAIGLEPTLMSLPESAKRAIMSGDVHDLEQMARVWPELMAELLRALPPGEATQWLIGWDRGLAAKVLVHLSFDRAAQYLELMEPRAAARLLERMSVQAAAVVLARARRSPAVRQLVALGHPAGSAILALMDLEVAADFYLQMEESGLPVEGWLAGMTRAMAAECIDLIDRHRSARGQARQLMRSIGNSHNGRGES